MTTIGPTLETLTRRIAETPEDFLAVPKVCYEGKISVPAVAHDLLHELGQTVAAQRLDQFCEGDLRRDQNWLSIILLLCWLLADDWFKRFKPETETVMSLFETTARQLAAQAASRKYVDDPDRREELVRTVLAHLHCRPAGETIPQAQDRLTSISSVERERVLRASREAEERARAIRAALVKKAAEESADKWTRE